MDYYVQYPDITEIAYLKGCGDAVAFGEKDVKTEFMFWLQACDDGKKVPEADSLGLKRVSSMNNWWPSHCGQERKLTLWWRHLPGKKNVDKPGALRRWCSRGNYHANFMNQEYAPNGVVTDIICQSLAGSGCGFKLIDKTFLKDCDYKCDLRARSFYRFFTLIRMPLELNKKEAKFMEDYNYRLLDTGKLATYWVNGWPSEKYSIKEEYKFFETSLAKWQKDESNY